MIKNYIEAARLRTLPLSVSGILVGSFVAASEELFNWNIFLLAILTTIGFQVLSNFANDYGDGIKGTDNYERIGPQRALQSGTISPSQMLLAIKITAFITFLIALLLIYVAFDKSDFLNLTIFFVLGIASIIAAITYTVGKKAYGYSGLGDLFVFIFFGLLSVVGSYYLYTKQLNFNIFIPASAIGLLSVGVLNLNNMRDRESDLKSDKKTLVVKIGYSVAKLYHFYLLLTSFLLLLWYAFTELKTGFQFLFIIGYFPIVAHLNRVYAVQNPSKLDQELKILALSTFLISILFGLGLFLANI